MADKGGKLNERVWKLFERAGFKTQPHLNDPNEAELKLEHRKRTLDLLAEDGVLGVKIIGSNKARKKLDSSFTAHVHDWEKPKKAAKADSVLFVSTDGDLSAEDRDYARKFGHSEQAVQMSVHVVRAFVRLREMIASHKALAKRLDELESRYDRQFKVVFDAIRELMTPSIAPRHRIGFQRERSK